MTSKIINNIKNEIRELNYDGLDFGLPRIFSDCIIVHLYSENVKTYIQIDISRRGEIQCYSIHKDVDQNGFYDEGKHIFPSALITKNNQDEYISHYLKELLKNN